MKFDTLFGALVLSSVCGLYAAPHLSAASPASTPSGNWRLVGPTTAEPMKDGKGGDVGRINTFAFDPTAPSTIYAASPSGGLWRTQDDGGTWELLYDFRPNGLQEIAVDPHTPSTMYALTGDGDGGQGVSKMAPPSVGILKSTDAGKTWTATGLQFAPADGVYGYRLAIDPHNAQILLAATSRGLYRTQDGGQTWSQATSGIPPTDMQWVDPATGRAIWWPTFFDVQFHPTDPLIVYAASQTQVYRSSDAGWSWTLLKNGLPTYNRVCDGNMGMPYCPVANPNYSNRIRLAVTPASPNMLYVLYGAPTGFTIGLYRSDDQGNTFTKRSGVHPPVASAPLPINLTTPNIFGRVDNDFASQSWYDIATAVSPTDADSVHMGGIDTWRSTNGGRNWTRTSFWDKPYSGRYTHADIHMLAYRPGSSVLYVASDGGIYRSTSDPDAKAPTITWQSITNLVTEAISKTITVAQIYHVCASPQQPDQLYYGAQDNGSYALDFNTGKIRWIAGGDGYVCQVDPRNPKTVFANTDQEIYRIDDATSAVWPKDAATMKVVTPTVGGQSLASQAAWVVPYIFGPAPSYGLYACYADLWRSVDRGDHWANLTNGALGPSVQCRQVAISQADPTTIYVAKQAANPFDAQTAQRLAALPPMLGGFGVFRSADGGATWHQVNGSGANALPLATGGQITDLAVSPIDPRRVWVTFSGYVYNSAYKVFGTTDGGAHWIDLSKGLPADHPAFSVVAAGGPTHGVYVGTDSGIYYRNDTLSNWTMLKDGLPDVPVYAMLLQDAQHRLLAATYGRGVWTADLNMQ